MSKYSKAKHSKESVMSFKILAIIFLILCVIGIFYISCEFINSNKNKSMYENIDNTINETQKDIVSKERTINMQKVINLKSENKDIIGWIQIENTLIDYPLLQTTDNSYYLTHNYKKEKSKYGSIYAKNKCNIQDNTSNIIIYGHNMKDAQMFNTLLKYEDINFYNEHKIIKIATEQKENKYEIVSVFKSRIFYQDEQNVFRYYNYTEFENEEKYNTFIEECKKIQLYDTEVSAKYGEQLITLITCEYSQENGRMVVVAKKNNL